MITLAQNTYSVSVWKITKLRLRSCMSANTKNLPSNTSSDHPLTGLPSAFLDQFDFLGTISAKRDGNFTDTILTSISQDRKGYRKCQSKYREDIVRTAYSHHTKACDTPQTDEKQGEGSEDGRYDDNFISTLVRMLLVVTCKRHVVMRKM
jgi:hypothetical protein